MKKILFSALLFAAFASFAGMAAAKADLVGATPFSVKVGAQFVSDSYTKDVVGDDLFKAGVEYDLPQSGSQALTSTNYFVYFDYDNGSKNNADGTGINVKTNIYGCGVGIKSSLSGGVSLGTSPYIGAGVGVYNVNFSYGGAGSGSNSTTGIGGKVLVGINFSQNYLLEADYTISPEKNSLKTNGFSALVGLRF